MLYMVCTNYNIHTSMLGLYPSSKVAMAANEPEPGRQKDNINQWYYSLVITRDPPIDT